MKNDCQSNTQNSLDLIAELNNKCPCPSVLCLLLTIIRAQSFVLTGMILMEIMPRHWSKSSTFGLLSPVRYVVMLPNSASTPEISFGIQHFVQNSFPNQQKTLTIYPPAHSVSCENLHLIMMVSTRMQHTRLRRMKLIQQSSSFVQMGLLEQPVGVKRALRWNAADSLLQVAVCLQHKWFDLTKMPCSSLP